MPRSWVDELVRAGAVAASYVPEAATGRGDVAEVAGAEPVEDAELAVHPVVPGSGPASVAFLDGIQYWRVVAYVGVAPVVRAHVAAAVRRRDRDRRPHTVAEQARELAIARLEALSAAQRRILESGGADLVDLPDAEAAQPARALEAARQAVERERVAVEKALGERAAAELAEGEWLVVDGVLSESAQLARHPRALGVIKSHSAQYFQGAELERALTIPAGHRTSVFRPRGRARHEVYAWYLRLWPWEGNDLLYGLLRIEAAARAETVARAGAISGWLLRERAPVSTPDARWDRLLYPIHDVETYLKSRVPRELVPLPASRLPRAAS